jgi:RNA polymerase sigma-70 factor (ECF subfamily)
MERDDRNSPGDITRLLDAWSRGDVDARDRLVPIVYDALRKRAAAQLRHEAPGFTLRPTELVHETYLRLCKQNAGWRNRDQFFGVAAQLMRRIIVDRARARKAQKRGQGLRVTLDAGVIASPPPPNADAVEVDAALEELSARSERQGRLVELRFFGGLTLDEAAAVLDISLATANRDWAHAKAWLFRRLKADLAAGLPTMP